MDINEIKQDNQQEYSRLNEELIVRLSNCYGDGAMLTSFFLIYYATIIVGLLQCIDFKNELLIFIIFGIVPLVVYFFPIVILHSFAEKYKENVLGLFNIALFSSIYHEKPVQIENKIYGKKWELLHKNTRKFASKHESKEYYFLAITSLALLLICFIVDLYLFLTMENKSTLIIVVSLITIMLYIILFVVSVRYIRKIRIATDMKKSEKIGEIIIAYYQKTKELLTDGKYDEKELQEKLSEIKLHEKRIDDSIEEDSYPYTKTIELINSIFNK